MGSSARRLSPALLALIGAAVLLLAVAVPQASARQVVTHTFSSSFDGALSTAGPFGNRISGVAVDEVSGDAYVLTNQFIVDKFDASGAPSAFTDPSLGGASSLTVVPDEEAFAPNLHIFVDNSDTATQGRIYVVFASFSNIVWAFEKSGAPVGGNYPLNISSLSGLSVDPNTGNFWTGVRDGGFTSEYTPAGVPTGVQIPIPSRTQLGGGGGSTGVDSQGYLYLGHGNGSGVGIDKYDQDGNFLYNILAFPLNEFPEFAIDQATDDLYHLSNAQVTQYDDAGSRIWHFGGPFGDAMGIAMNGASGRVYIARSGSERVDIYTPDTTVTVPDVSTGGSGDFDAPEVTVHGSVNPDGVTTTECGFEWSTDTSFGNTTTCAEGAALGGTSQQAVSATITGLKKGQTYNYRIAAANPTGQVTGLIKSFVVSDKPALADEWSTDVHSDGVLLHSEVTPEGAPTQYFFEYGLEDCAVSSCTQTPATDMGAALSPTSVSGVVTGLEPGTTYHYRVVANNQSGAVQGADRTFTTFPFTEVLKDPCPNAHVRQQVGAALLPDCRAYELVSAPDTGGYDVESDLVAGLEPFGSYPEAEGRALYGVHTGAIPGPWNPTNHGVDPYLATRGEKGWTTDYVGLPADNPYAGGPFASSLDEANAQLTNFAFGGPDICSPCFADGSTGLPLRLADGTIEQGMAPIAPGLAAISDGLVKKRFSADGTHLVFGSTSQFAAGGNDETGDVSIYDRNLNTGLTQVVSTNPGGTALTCLQGAGQCHSPAHGAGIAELDISEDGSHIVVGQLVGDDSKGNRYFHLYMHIGTSPNTIDLTPGAASGVQYDGMTSDGSIVYFTTKDALTTGSDQDTDTSADIYRGDVGATSATLTRVSTGAGGTGNTDSCSPAGTPDTWNAASGEGKCGAVAFAGGAGVASDSGSFYFVSPERLDTSDPGNEPVQDQANLYVSEPGSAPSFVTTMDTSQGKPGPPPPNHPLANPALVSGLNGAASIAVDQSNGDVYAIEHETEDLARFTSAGAPDNFSVPGGSNKITIEPGAAGRSQVAVDNAPGSPFQGDFYVKSGFASVAVFAPTGEQLGFVDEEEFGACGVAVDQSNGVVYLSSRFEGIVWRFEPVSSAKPVTAASYVKTGIETQGIPSPCNLAADTEGHVYVTQGLEGPVLSYDASEFAAGAPAAEGALVDPVSRSVAVDPESDDVYVDEGNQIAVFDSSGALIQRFGSGSVGTASRGIAVNASTKHVYASTESTVVDFGFEVSPFVPVDNPAVRHGVDRAEVHDYSDFEVTADGHYAAFASLLPLTGYDSNDLYEVFRYDAQQGEVDCASCNTTNARPEGGSALPDKGLGLAADGDVFFNSNDAIAPRDLDKRLDAYEWDGNSPQLISTGASPFDSSLLGISRDGTDAFFFTYDTLVPEDRNGSLVKLYDARAGGGFAYVPPPVPCKASDECHGAGSAAPGALPINTITGQAGNKNAPEATRCRKGFVRRHGRCVRRRHRAHSANRHRKKHQRANGGR